MPKIFISYRRKDSAQIVGRIYERLLHEFGKSNVFYDIETIPKGENFTEVLRQNVASCDVLLAIIGSQWASIVDANGNKRLSDESDYVRYEVDTALRIPKIKVIPILINGAEIPAAADLPRVLQPITNLNAAIIRNDPDFQSDMDKLVGLLSPRRSPYLTWVALAVALVIVGLIAFAPRLFSAAVPTITPTVTASSVPPTNMDTPMPTLNVPTVGTATPQSVQSNITSTEIILLPRVDTTQTANAVLMAERTHLAETAKAMPTATPVPSNTLKPSVTPVPPSPTPIPATVIPSPTNTLQTLPQATSSGGYPCPATIVDNTGNATILNQIHSEAVYASSPIASVRVGQAVSVLKKELEGSRTVWYQIGNDQGKAIGYILEDYVRLSPSCPQ